VPENDSEAVEIDSAHVLAESAALEKYFQHGLRLEMNTDELEGSEDNEDEQEGVLSDEDDSQGVDNPRTHSALVWADKFILETRRKGGRQTENSVLKLWKVCRKSVGNFSESPLSLINLDLGFRGNKLWPPARHDRRFKSYD